ncbi:TetR/AcrR family transcriptional regulator [Streptomyces blattellae]|uniref:TetR/AcrR family transcriptional regulator n=1 Tax=Streptomyces blattellae TaxID=2569855 RepID=UPI0018AC9647|nr:TetR/AcrR family transcriptional regulator [Streptomyces blattellae]
MGESVTALKRKWVAERIARCAQALAEERGIDGFTMDDVAECAGVSRRTLFNYVPGKLDAILGAAPDPDPALFSEFLAGGPTGRLGEDIKAVVGALLDSKDTAADDVERVRRLIASDPRLHKAMRDRFGKVATFFAEAILTREGPDADPLRGRVAATVTLALFDLALENFVADPETSLVDHYMRVFGRATALFD